MAHYLPPGSTSDSGIPAYSLSEKSQDNEMGDLKIFWGPEICRIEYLLHLLETGRIKEEPSSKSA